MLIVLSAGSATALEEIPEFEVFGGYSLLKMGASTKDIRSFQDGFFDRDTTWHNKDTSFFLSRGGVGSVAFNYNEKFSVVADVKYNQGNLIKGTVEYQSPLESQPTIQLPFAVGIKNVAALAGPRISLRKKEGTAFFHVLAGLDYWRLNGEYILDGKKCSESDDKFGPGIAIGGGIDVNVNEKFAVRVIQADYYMTRQMERWMNNVNLSFGLVFRIGEIVLR